MQPRDPERAAPARKQVRARGPDTGPQAAARGAGTGDGTSTGPRTARSSGKALAALALGAVVAVAAMKFFAGGPYAGPEEEAPNYSRHQQAARLATPPPVVLGDDDVDRQTTRAAVAAAKRGEPIPAAPDLPPPTVRAVAEEEVKFYSMHLYDTCAEDGDVVRVTLGNGMQYGPITITHAGTTITVPLSTTQPPQITLHAEKDGGGGVTVGIRTSDGTWYSNVLPVGATQPIPLGFR